MMSQMWWPLPCWSYCEARFSRTDFSKGEDKDGALKIKSRGVCEALASYVLIPFRRAPAMVVSLAVPFQLKRTDSSISKHSFQFTWHSFRFTWFTGPSLTESTVSVRHSTDRQQDLASFAQRRSAVEEAVFHCKPCEKEPRELMFGQITWGRRR